MNLFPHQRTGVEWLAARPRAGLFDEPGLGKTAVAICAADRRGGRLLVAVPAVAAYNWAREVRAWSPNRRVQVVTSGSTTLDSRADAVIVTHGLLIRPALLRQLTSTSWDNVVLDESHNFRNPMAKRTRAFYGVPGRKHLPSVVASAKGVWALTGTPMPNNPTELWAMLAGLAPERITMAAGGPPMTWWQFRARFCKLAPTSYGDGWKVVGAQNVPELRARLAGFALRRLKSQHLNLPPIRWGTLAVEAEEVALAEINAALSPEMRALIEHATPDEALELLRENEQFSRFRRLCGLAKINPVVELLAGEARESNEQLVLFAHHTEVIDGLVARLRTAGFSTKKIDGGVSRTTRQSLVDRFQAKQLRVLVCQLTAGGVAITLTAAQRVILVEQSFVPGDNVQAADRLHRIGQDRPVLVQLISLARSIDELLVDVLARKTAMIREVLR